MCMPRARLLSHTHTHTHHARVAAKEEFENGNVVGLDVTTGEPFDPVMAGVLDNYIVKKQVGGATCARARALFFMHARLKFLVCD